MQVVGTTVRIEQCGWTRLGVQKVILCKLTRPLLSPVAAAGLDDAGVPGQTVRFPFPNRALVGWWNPLRLADGARCT